MNSVFTLNRYFPKLIIKIESLLKFLNLFKALLMAKMFAYLHMGRLGQEKLIL